MPISKSWGECPKCGSDMDEYEDAGQWLCHDCGALWDVYPATCPVCKGDGKIKEETCRKCNGGPVYEYLQAN